MISKTLNTLNIIRTGRSILIEPCINKVASATSNELQLIFERGLRTAGQIDEKEGYPKDFFSDDYIQGFIASYSFRVISDQCIEWMLTEQQIGKVAQATFCLLGASATEFENFSKKHESTWSSEYREGQHDGNQVYDALIGRESRIAKFNAKYKYSTLTRSIGPTKNQAIAMQIADQTICSYIARAFYSL